MTKTSLLTSIAALATVAAAAAATAQPRPAGAGGTVTYWMSAETTSGLAAMSQSGRPARCSSAMTGAHVRRRRLLCPQPDAAARQPAPRRRRARGRASAAERARRRPVAAPALARARRRRSRRPIRPRPTRRATPQGRILIYWGCGERARPGQPFEIDLARLRPGQMPPAMAQMAIQAMNPPSAASSTTYGEWPNERSHAPVPGQRLAGRRAQHPRQLHARHQLHAGARGNDFLAPIAITQNSPAPSRAVPVAWQTVPDARAFFMMATGAARGRHDRDVELERGPVQPDGRARLSRPTARSTGCSSSACCSPPRPPSARCRPRWRAGSRRRR